MRTSAPCSCTECLRPKIRVVTDIIIAVVLRNGRDRLSSAGTSMKRGSSSASVLDHEPLLGQALEVENTHGLSAALENAVIEYLECRTVRLRDTGVAQQLVGN